ncbi:MAG: hypothetical protein Tsb0016_04810 [Sphingomonadales bacterium]
MAMRRFLGLAMLILALPASPAGASDDHRFEGEDVLKRGDFAEDLFIAGRTVDLRGSAQGDMFAAAGTVYVDAAIADDAFIAGGEVNLNGAAADGFVIGGQIDSRADIADNLMLAGGSVSVSGRIGGQLIAAGGRVRLDPGLQVAGDVKLAGGDVGLAGRIGGNVSVTAQSLRIAPETRIDGKLVYRGPTEPTMPAGAVIAGGIDYRPIIGAPDKEELKQAFGTAATVISVVWIGGLFLLGAVLYLVFPGLFGGLARVAQAKPWTSLGLGFAFLAVVPAAIFVLLVTVIGTVPALIMIPAYAIALLLGYIGALLALAHAVTARWLGGPDKRGRLVLIYLALLILASLISAVPVIGWLLGLMLTLVGVGGLIQQAVPARG